MLLLIAKVIIILFGLFIISIGILMLVSPERARNILKKAGSTPFINYAEITFRLFPAISLIIYSEFAIFPVAFKILGWFMLATSIVLYFVPRRLHHNYSLKSAEILKPVYVRLLSPVSILFGSLLIYGVS